MSYRTCIDEEQIFGNNEYYEEWIEFIKNQGITVGEDGEYEGETVDVEGLFKTIDKIARRLMKERHERVVKGEKGFKGEPIHELADLSNSMFLSDRDPILLFNLEMVKNAYIFLPYTVYNILRDKLEKDYEHPYKDDKLDWWYCSYRLKDGEKIKLRAG